MEAPGAGRKRAWGSCAPISRGKPEPGGAGGRDFQYWSRLWRGRHQGYV